MMKVRILFFSCLILSGCAGGWRYPQLLGPATDVNCTLSRVEGSVVGEYECRIKGNYQLNEFGW